MAILIGRPTPACAAHVRHVLSCLGLLFFAAAPALGGPVVDGASLAGSVYVDTNHNGVMDSGDMAVVGASISLAFSNGSGSAIIAKSLQDGSYNFTGLAEGTYTLTILTPCCVTGQDLLGIVWDKSGTAVTDGRGTVGDNVFTGIVLGTGYSATDYNFGEGAYPIQLISKRLLLSNSPAVQATADPEPVLQTNPGTGGTLSFGAVLVNGTGSTGSSTNTLNAKNIGAEGSSLTGLFPAASGEFAQGTPATIGPLGITDPWVPQEYIYTPTGRGTDSPTITVMSNGGNSTITLSGQGVAPVAGTLTAVDAPKTLVGQTTAATVTVKNTGDGNLSGLGAVSNLNGTISAGVSPFSLSGSNAISLLDNTSQTYNYTYAPTTRGANSSPVTVNYSNGSANGTNQANTQSVTINGQGVAPVQSVTVAPNNPLVRVGTSGAVGLTVTNTGDGNLSGLGDASNLKGAVGPSSGVFVGAGGGVNLADGLSQAFDYMYTPTGRTVDSATIPVTFTDGNSDGSNTPQSTSALLAGQGVGPVYDSVVAPNGTMDFGTLWTPAFPDLPQTRILTLTVKNTTTDPNGGDSTLTDLTLLDATFSGADAGLFHFVDFSQNTVIHAGASLDLHIEFLGSDSLGARLASLLIATDENVAYQAVGGTSFTYQVKAEVVPEPSTLALLGVGLGGLAVVLYRRRRAG